ncbi:four-jointed box protein 1-like [Limulus polyphemus]|uniref:Four-jointed box protein 1-like n=1 Tax=Limulus polyphemus TaxID=6850 RepID=A0ABM1B3Y9_LIMPO|nr:four-jointed box protein 1-like [Limulus polyphemus]
MSKPKTVTRNTPRTVNVGFRRLSRNMFLASVGIAFTAGMLLGILLPVYMFRFSPNPEVSVSRQVDQQLDRLEPLTQIQSVTQASVVPSPVESDEIPEFLRPSDLERAGESHKGVLRNEVKEGQASQGDMFHSLTTSRLALTNDFLRQGQVAATGRKVSTPLAYFGHVVPSEQSLKSADGSLYFPKRKLNSETEGATNQGFRAVVGVENTKLYGSFAAKGNIIQDRQTTITLPPRPRWLSVNRKNRINISSNSIDDILPVYTTHPSFPVTPIPLRNQGFLRSNNDPETREIANIVNGIYWAEELERIIPNGFSDGVDSWCEFVNKTKVVKISEGCGRMQNRLVTFDNGNKSCCRYRQNNDQIQGEIFSFYLSRLLKIGNLPPSVLALIRGQEWQWEHVQSQLHLAQWNAEKPVVLTKFVDSLMPAFIPSAFRDKHRQLYPVAEDLFNKTVAELVELAQWSDLIVFDYLTANLDRVVNNMYNEQWNPEMMNSPTHNLAKHKQSGLLVFLDNESGLLHGYRLLEKYEHFHRSLLDSLCVFRRRTAQSIVELHRTKNTGELLKLSFLKYNPSLVDWLPFLPERSLKTLTNRINTVYNQIQKCEAMFN